MALRMEEGVRHAHNHRRTTLPKRTSLTEAKTTTVSKVRISRGKPHVLAAPRRNGDVAKSIKESASPAIATPAAVAMCAGRIGSGSGVKHACADDSAAVSSVARANSNRSGTTGRGAVTGNGHGRVGGHSLARKRVRVVDDKLGTFVVFLARYEGDHNDVCEVCDKGGDLLCCDFCNLVYHLACVTPKLTEVPSEELWLCPACRLEVTNRQMLKRKRLEDSGRTSPGPVAGRRQGQNQDQNHGQVQAQDKVPSFRGVKPENGGFRAFVLHRNHTVDLGLHSSARAAARAYDRKALSLFGDSAKCNFPGDELMEVEGVGSDGSAVKGAVRSFHQWRAEMLWGYKKRHLGFFDRLEDAAYAYNRATLHMNGPEAQLNPIKEDYIPPPPTGAPVRVPRNKFFAQQLPLPLSARAQPEDGVVQSAQQRRRRYQMHGKYHVPMVGESHQVSYLPPLPPPSRPFFGVPASTPSNKGPEISPTVEKGVTSGMMGIETGDIVATARRCESGADAADPLEDGVESSVPSTVTPLSQSPTEGHKTELSPKDFRWGVDSTSPAIAAAPVLALTATGKSLTLSSGVENLAHQTNVVDPKFAGRTKPNESKVQMGNTRAVTPERRSQIEEATVATVATGRMEVAPATPLEVQKPSPAPFHVPKMHEATGKITIRIPRRVILSYGNPKSSALSPPVADNRPSDNDEECDDEVSDESDPPLPEISPSTSGGREGDQWSDDSGTPEGGQMRPKPTSSTLGVSCSEMSPFQKDCPAPMLETETFLPPSEGGGGEAVVDVAEISDPAEGRIPAIRIRRLPRSIAGVSAVHEGDLSMLPSRASPCTWSSRTVSSGDSGGIESSCGWGVSSVSCDVAPPSLEAPPIPDLSFEDVAELVWDPRSGPKPKGAGDGKKDENSRRLAVERTMWERDSTLLGRVAPAHMEKAMQVLQTCRHDVEKAAQLLSVRHGIHVIGLSNVRKTRHSLAEQQAAVADGIGSLESGRGTDAASLRTLGKKSDAQGYSREEISLAGRAFMQHGRNLEKVTKQLGWKKNRVVSYYYSVWKYSPAYQVWKARRRQTGLREGGNRAVSGGASWSVDDDQAKRLSDGMRWRGSRLRTLKTPCPTASP